jgi:hypothetical protein
LCESRTSTQNAMNSKVRSAEAADSPTDQFSRARNPN